MASRPTSVGRVANFYSRPTPPLRLLNHLVDRELLFVAAKSSPWALPRRDTQCSLPDTGFQPAAAVVPALVMRFTVWVTWLSVARPRTEDRVSAPPGAAQFQQVAAQRSSCHFRGQNTEASPYPSIAVVRHRLGPFSTSGGLFGNVSQTTDRQALSPVGDWAVHG